MGDRDSVESPSAAAPEIGRHNFLADIEVGMCLPRDPPASNRTVLPSGVTISTESLCLKSIAVTPGTPGRHCIFGGVKTR